MSDLEENQADQVSLSISTIHQMPLRAVELIHLDHHLDGTKGLNRVPLTQFRLIEANTDREAIESWLNEVGSRSKQTLRTYRKEAERFLLWSVYEMNKPLSSLNAMDVQAYSEFLKDPKTRHYDEANKPLFHWIQKTIHDPQTGQPMKTRYRQTDRRWTPFDAPLSPKSIEHAMTILKSMFSYWCNAGYVSLNPFMLRKPLVNRKENTANERTLTIAHWKFIYEYLSDFESRMPKAFDDNTKKRINYLIEGERVKCIFVCLYLMGLRISELADFKMSDIRFRDHREDGHYWANITGKGQKVRTVPVSTECLDHIIAYRKAINVLAEPNPPVTEKPNREDQSTVILSLRKTKTGQFKALTANALHKVIKATFDSIYNELINGEFDHGEFVKIDPVLFKKASAHWMRHTSATHQSLDGTTLQELKVNLGHSSIETTTIYNSIDDENRAIKASKFKANKIVEEKS